eukprot:scaffold26654_cov135-Isochrysis_galbana.AAC.1
MEQRACWSASARADRMSNIRARFGSTRNGVRERVVGIPRVGLGPPARPTARPPERSRRAVISPPSGAT